MVDEDNALSSHLQWARILVKYDGSLTQIVASSYVIASFVASAKVEVVPCGAHRRNPRGEGK